MITGQLVADAAVVSGGGVEAEAAAGTGPLGAESGLDPVVATGEIAVPHSVQNRNDAGLPWPQTVHATLSEVPQLPQNLALAGFSKAQLWQVIRFRTHPSFHPRTWMRGVPRSNVVSATGFCKH